jgi:(E)-4-hydroxy-3-methyl-but-2-enyl pyrophosphate reductase
VKTRLARTAGFCMGVRRAMELALGAAHDEKESACTYGPLIHNPQVLDMLEGKGVSVLEGIPEENTKNGGTVIIRAHGVPPEDKASLKKAGYGRIIDGTCPRVVRVQAIIRKAAKQRKQTVIVGDAHHPEVVGLFGHSAGKGHVVSSLEEVAALPDMQDVVVVAQTTQSEQKYADIVAALKERFKNVEVHQTICEATRRRQDEVIRIAREVDGVVVVGGRDSGNTKRLGELAAAEGKPVFMVETEQELDQEALSQLGSVGVTAGASTPNWMIKRVMREVGNIRSARQNQVAYLCGRVFRFLVRSQIVVAVGAASMTLASCLLQGITPSFDLISAAAMYIYAMHILNHFLDKEAGQYNEPDRAHFLSKYQGFLIGAGIASGVGSLALCLELGYLPLGLVAVMSVLGLLYTAPLIPGGLMRRTQMQRLKDIPGSKTMSATVAWALVVAVLPALTQPPLHAWYTLLVFFFTLVMVFIRCTLFDMLDVQGDLIVGKETIPILLGERKTEKMLWWLLLGLAVVLPLAALTGAASSLAFCFLAPVAGMAAMQYALTRFWVMPGALSEGLVDLNFWLAGAMTLIWWLW